MKLILKEVYQNSRFITTETIELIYIAFDKNARKRSDAAFNHKSLVSILQKLSKDPDKFVRMWVTQNLNITSSMLDFLSKDKDYHVRLYVTKNLRTPIKTLMKLSRDNDSHVCESAKKHLTYIKYQQENGLI